METKRSTSVRRGHVLARNDLNDVQRALRQHGTSGAEILAERAGVNVVTVTRAAAGCSCHRAGLRAIAAAARALLAESGGAVAA